MKQQLSVKIEKGQLVISIGIALLAHAVQSSDQWSEDFRVTDIQEFAKSMVRRLAEEEEDGTTPVHRMFDVVADQVLEQGDDGVDEGDVEEGIALAGATMEGLVK